MRKVKIYVMVGIAVLMMLGALSACGTPTVSTSPSNAVPSDIATPGGETPGASEVTRVTTPLKFGYNYPIQAYFFDAVTVGGQDEAKVLNDKYGAAIEVVANSDPNAAVTGAVQILEDMISQDYDGIAISVIDPTAITPVLQKALDAGIQVCTFDTDAESSLKRLCFIGSDNAQFGHDQAKYVADVVLKGTGGVLIQSGSATMLNLVTRFNNEKEVFATYPNIKILDSQIPQAGASTEAMMTLVENMITAHPEFDCLLNDNAGGEAMVNVWRAKPWKSTDKNCVLCDDLNPVIQAVKDGVINATQVQWQYNWGKVACDVLYDACCGILPTVDAKL